MTTYISYEMSSKSEKIVIWASKNSIRIWNSRHKNLTKETALHGEIDFVDRSALRRYVRENCYFCMDKSNWKIYFHNSLGIKVVYAGPVNAVLISQQKQYNAPVERIIKFVAAVYGLCTVAFRVYKWMDFDIYIGNDNEFVF